MRESEMLKYYLNGKNEQCCLTCCHGDEGAGAIYCEIGGKMDPIYVCKFYEEAEFDEHELYEAKTRIQDMKSVLSIAADRKENHNGNKRILRI